MDPEVVTTPVTLSMTNGSGAEDRREYSTLPPLYRSSSSANTRKTDVPRSVFSITLPWKVGGLKTGAKSLTSPTVMNTVVLFVFTGNP